jgi:hypothetical protein
LMRLALRTLAAGLVLALMTGVTANAQVGSTAQITGTVKDDGGGVLPGVDVTATQTDTGFKRSVVTDEMGAYTLTNLPIGPYRLEATLSGFRSYAQTGIVLQVNANPVINVTLAIGQVSETVTVDAAAPLVETRSPSIGTVIENERIEELPLNGRQATDLIVIAGAAVSPGVAANATSRSMQGGVGIAVAGGQTFGVAYVLDGAIHNNPYDNLNLPLPFPDALQEFRLETSSTNANNGMHSGASVNLVTKSGTNLYHGDLFEFFRHHRFNATDPFARPGPDGKRLDDGLVRNQYGGTIGGPLRTDRIFFFGAFQGTKLRQRPSDVFAFIPTAQMLAGDFTTFASAQCNAAPVQLRAPYLDNRVDPSQFSPAALRIVSRLGTTTSDPCGRVNYTTARPQNEDQYIGKVDVQINNNHSIFGRYMVTTVLFPVPFAETGNILSTNIGGRDNIAHSLTIGDTMVLSNNMVNSLRFAWNYTDIHRTHEPFGFSAPDVGINTFSYLDEYMLLNITNGFQLGGGTESEARFKTPSYNISDDLTLIRGNHQFGLGASVGYWTSLSEANVRSPGQFTFNGQLTGLGLADFLVGRVSEYTQAVPNTLDMKQWYLGVYAQDTWKTSARTTLNYGVRWEPGLAQQIRNGAIYNFSIDRYLRNERSTVFRNAPAGFLYPGDDGFVNGNAGMENHWLQFSPRVGFAWDLTGDGRTVVRSGYSLGYDFVNAQFHLNTSVAWPWGAEVRFNDPAGRLDNPFLGSGQANIFPVTFDQNAPFGLYGPYIAIPPDIDLPRQQAWNLTVERQIGQNLAVRASYLGSYSDRLWNVRSLNEGQFMGTGPCTLQTPTGPQTFATCTVPQSLNFRRNLSIQNFDQGKFLGALDEHTALGEQRYKGLLLQATRRSANGLTAGVNYTLSKCEGHATQGGTTPNINSGYVNPDDIDYDYGACTQDRRHIFNLTLSATTPEFGARALRAVASNWRVSGIFRATSGEPITVTVNTDPAGTGIGNQRANVVGDPYGEKTVNNYLNINSFTIPTPGTYGDQRRGSITGFGDRNLDIAVVRGFRFGTHLVEARIESFNAFNWMRPTLTNQNTNRNAPATFGRATSVLQNSPRVMQVAVKYSF